jgi:hypothetical protein
MLKRDHLTWYNCMVYYLKHNPTKITYYGKKQDQMQLYSYVTDSPNLLCDTHVNVTPVARLLHIPEAAQV